MKKFSTDSSFHIGTQHLRSGLPCQDYAAAGKFYSDRLAYAIVSDGCSTGGRTDIGVRLITLATENYLDGTGLAHSHEGYANELGLCHADLLATRMVATASDEIVIIQVHGDGVIAWVDGDDILTMTKMDWANNMPCYPIYRTDNYKAFVNAQGGYGTQAFNAEVWINDHGNLFSSHFEKFIILDDLLQAGYKVFLEKNVKQVAVFSDGVTQVGDMRWQDVVHDLMNFKSTEGAFVKRRMNRFLHDNQDHHPIDDISMAAIVIGNEDNAP